jgi:hypothetical protein
VNASELTRQGKNSAQKARAENAAPAQKIVDAIMTKRDAIPSSTSV